MNDNKILGIIPSTEGWTSWFKNELKEAGINEENIFLYNSNEEIYDLIRDNRPEAILISKDFDKSDETMENVRKYCKVISHYPMACQFSKEELKQLLERVRK